MDNTVAEHLRPWTSRWLTCIALGGLTVTFALLTLLRTLCWPRPRSLASELDLRDRLVLAVCGGQQANLALGCVAVFSGSVSLSLIIDTPVCTGLVSLAILSQWGVAISTPAVIIYYILVLSNVKAKVRESVNGRATPGRGAEPSHQANNQEDGPIREASDGAESGDLAASAGTPIVRRRRGCRCDWCHSICGALIFVGVVNSVSIGVSYLSMADLLEGGGDSQTSFCVRFFDSPERYPRRAMGTTFLLSALLTMVAVLVLLRHLAQTRAAIHPASVRAPTADELANQTARLQAFTRPPDEGAHFHHYVAPLPRPHRATSGPARDFAGATARGDFRSGFESTEAWLNDNRGSSVREADREFYDHQRTRHVAQSPPPVRPRSGSRARPGVRPPCMLSKDTATVSLSVHHPLSHRDRESVQNTNNSMTCDLSPLKYHEKHVLEFPRNVSTTRPGESLPGSPCVNTILTERRVISAMQHAYSCTKSTRDEHCIQPDLTNDPVDFHMSYLSRSCRRKSQFEDAVNTQPEQCGRDSEGTCLDRKKFKFINNKNILRNETHSIHRFQSYSDVSSAPKSINVGLWFTTNFHPPAEQRSDQCMGKIDNIQGQRGNLNGQTGSHTRTDVQVRSDCHVSTDCKFTTCGQAKTGDQVMTEGQDSTNGQVETDDHVRTDGDTSSQGQVRSSEQVEAEKVSTDGQVRIDYQVSSVGQIDSKGQDRSGEQMEADNRERRPELSGGSSSMLENIQRWTLEELIFPHRRTRVNKRRFIHTRVEHVRHNILRVPQDSFLVDLDPERSEVSRSRPSRALLAVCQIVCVSGLLFALTYTIVGIFLVLTPTGQGLIDDRVIYRFHDKAFEPYLSLLLLKACFDSIFLYAFINAPATLHGQRR